ncbi:nitrate reductase [Gemmobacter sp.]|uniref:nitrate reductase n=1 Tax=Gemmobacter sp. TaxID=1898957 RepID=UPI0025C69C9E|nr:nitrate reductase [Gemmobacter sp.]
MMERGPIQPGGIGETRSTCPYCGVGCGVILRADAAGGVTVQGDPDHPANFGRLCSKGTALGETVGLEGRLLAPRLNGQEVGWDEALAHTARRFAETIATHGPDSVAFYVSGQLLTEDYYAANKLMKGFIGSANIDTNSRLCMASSVAGHRRAFGTDTVPGQYEDFEQADLVVLVGSNLAWCHPVLFQRLTTAKEARPAMKIVVIDPRRTATCALADLHLPIAPGADTALFNHLLCTLADQGRTDPAFLAHVNGYDAALAAARNAGETGLSPEALAEFLALWAQTERVVTIYSQGVNQSAQGTDKVNAILNCHLATGRIGRPGMGPFSVTGQPNAMGGREVGGLANMLACHLEIENPDHRAAVQGFWAAPTIAPRPGLKAVDMFRAVEEGRIKALWIMCTNPAVSMPEADRVAAAIRACDFVVVSDCMAETDTTRLAHVLLPAATWGERDGTVTNSERRISRQRPFRPAPGQARQDWRIIAGVAARMGWAEAFNWHSSAEVFAEYAALSGVAGGLGSDFDISDHAQITPQGYDALKPFVWPAAGARQGGRFFAAGTFHTPDGKARMLPIATAPVAPRDPAHPFRLNTGRIRDQWHTMTRTGLSARLGAHIAEPFLEINPQDAARLSIAPAALVQVENAHGRALLRALVTDRVQQGQVFAPIHWTGETAPSGRIDVLVPSVTDPVSGQPDSKAAAVSVRAFDAGWYGFAVSAQAFRPDCDYWAIARAETGYRAELAGHSAPEDWEAFARTLFGLPQAALTAVTDPRRGVVRMALTDAEGRLQAALFIAPDPVALSRGFVTAALGEAAEAALLSGQPGANRPDAGATICACFGVGLNTIVSAITEGRALTVAALGQSLRAGTNCGACRPDLAALIARHRQQDTEAA